MRVIIRCAGSGERWGDHLGVPKHLAPLCGEPVLHRAVRLVTELAPDADVRVVVPSLTDRRYLVPGSRRVTDRPTPANGDLDKVASSRHLWDRDGRTVLLWGDTWWGIETLADVLTRPLDAPHTWLRATAGGGGEVFAFAFEAEHLPRVDAALDRALDAHHAGELANGGHLGLPVRGGWALYRALRGAAWDAGGDHGGSTIVTDWTEDMDTPRDWDRWCLRWAESAPADRPR